MKAAFIIFIRAVGLYAILSLPLLFMHPAYFISLKYVLTYGWIAWGLFTMSYVLLNKLSPDFGSRVFGLFLSAVFAVATAYHVMGLTGVEEAGWDSIFIIFPFAAVISGWISICISKETIRNSCYRREQGIE